jgi:4-hydroxybenzoate polyprenyltransferase
MKAWLQLVRLPNVFTAIADVMMGYLVTHGSLGSAPKFSLLAAASCLLYMSGTALNDAFDADVDARDRPDRPIPSGCITKRAGIAGGFALLCCGVLTTWFTSIITQDWRPAIIGTLLATCVVLYDYTLKWTPVAPLVMGACRMLNVLLGMSLAKPLPDGMPNVKEYFLWESPATWLIAGGVGTYVVGVTWFARNEARTSSRLYLIGGTIVILFGMAMLASVPHWNESEINPPLVVSALGWYLLWLALALITVRRCILAIYEPTPPRVQAAVRHCVISIIVLDAAVCVGFIGPAWSFTILALLLPTVLLAAWLKVT